ncbi:E3 UFM1-protein ligase 1 homolog isoform X2 [Helianthus annuus]|uniref:E3 UFM1-protein ligase 1 homolog isoform X2 n=1 Tax=Helianthus annuus TaxID=4232 RepID=UPI001652E90C|nr:E3 UFM1-protein ligase 1 homolog isoform X2 [Helianthus annuus]XP_035844457.1 E3 UFM1-protein ligase 1 homolog isoform X2 [Helianthus annuus]
MTHHDESSLNMQLYKKGLDLFDNNPTTSALLHRHLLKNTVAPMIDMLLSNLDMLSKLKNGIEVQDFDTIEPITLSSWDRMALVKKFEGALSVKGNAAVEALEGKRVKEYMTVLRAFADECGLTVKMLDKKLERTLLHSYRKVNYLGWKAVEGRLAAKMELGCSGVSANYLICCRCGLDREDTSHIFIKCVVARCFGWLAG